MSETFKLLEKQLQSILNRNIYQEDKIESDAVRDILKEFRNALTEIQELQTENAELKKEISMFEAMKEGVEIRIGDLTKRAEQAEAENAALKEKLCMAESKYDTLWEKHEEMTLEMECKDESLTKLKISYDELEELNKQWHQMAYNMSETCRIVSINLDKIQRGDITYCEFCNKSYPSKLGIHQIIEHITQCPEHPFGKMKARAEKAEASLNDTIKALHNAKAANATLDQKLQDAQAAFIADEKAIKASLKLQAELEQENDAMRAKVEFYESR